MVSRSLLRQIDSFDDDIQSEINELFAEGTDWLPADAQAFGDDKIVVGRVRKVTADSVFVDVGFKSEGVIDLREWFDDEKREIIPPAPGDELDVLVETVEDASGAVTLSYRKARWQKAWQNVIATKKEGDVVSGPVVRKIKGGLLVNIGVNVFLPASQIDVRRSPDLGEFIGKTIECKIVAINQERRNVVVSRRRLIEDQRSELKSKLLAEIEPGQTRTGVVKNLASFGAFVDLGGIDGLLHITDMAWHRVESPDQIVQINQTLEVFIIKVDKTTEKISIGLKQLTKSPWAGVAERFPVGSVHPVKVVNITAYGAFVCLEPGLEGLVHISEMSWTKRINHPSEVVEIGDTVNVQVLQINQDKKEISLGIKQTLENPWDGVFEKYPTGKRVEGTVKNFANYGAFVEIEEGVDGLVHVNDMSWVRKISHPKEVMAVGDKIPCVVLEVDRERRRIALGMKQIAEDPWATDIPTRYKPGEVKTGTVTKITNFGVFVELEPGLEGLLHISECPPASKGTIAIGDSLEVVVLRVEVAERKLALGTKPVPGEETEASADAPRDAATAGRPREKLRGGVGRPAIDPSLLSLNPQDQPNP